MPGISAKGPLTTKIATVLPSNKAKISRPVGRKGARGTPLPAVGLKGVFVSGSGILWRVAVLWLFSFPWPAYGAMGTCSIVMRANQVIAGRGPSLSRLRRESAAGDGGAQVLVSLYYAYRYPYPGFVHPRKRRRALLRWMRTAARGGNPLSVYLYDEEAIEYGRVKHHPSMVRAAQRTIGGAFLELSNKARHPCGALDAFIVASAYAQGVNVKKSTRESRLWARLAARDDSSIGSALMAGWNLWSYRIPFFDVKGGCKKGAKWARRSIREGNPEAEMMLGDIYGAPVCFGPHPLVRLITGNAQRWWRILQAHQAKANIWFKKAADRGVAAADYRLGVAYSAGLGVRSSPSKGLRFMVRAYHDGVPMAASAASIFTENMQAEIEKDYKQGHPQKARNMVLALRRAAREHFPPAETVLRAVASARS